MYSLKQKLGKRIQEIRKSKHITQEKLAEKIGLDTPNLSNIERGKRFVSCDTLEKIINALDVNESELFDFGYIKTRTELLELINNIMSDSTDREIEYYYRLIMLFKNFTK